MTLGELKEILDLLVTKLPEGTPICADHDKIYLAPDVTLDDLSLDAAETLILRRAGPVIDGRDGLCVFT